jgi:hypothetical protein
MPTATAAFLRRVRSSSLSIGQLTFSGFLCVLTVILITGVASVLVIRHIDATFAELQRLQTVGELAVDIDRSLNGLRLAARDFVTDPDARPDKVSEAAAVWSVTSGVAASNAARSCGSPASRSARRAMSAVTCSMPRR